MGRKGEERQEGRREGKKKGRKQNLRPLGNRTPDSYRYRCFLSDLAGLAARPPSGSRRKRASALLSKLVLSYWCPGGDSNSHAIQRYHLKIVCLPIPPPGHEAELIEIRPAWQAFFCLFRRKNTFFKIFLQDSHQRKGSRRKTARLARRSAQNPRTGLTPPRAEAGCRGVRPRGNGRRRGWRPLRSASAP